MIEPEGHCEIIDDSVKIASAVEHLTEPQE